MTTTPRRTGRGEKTGVDTSWPREYRLIFSLVDGRRSRKDIATLLHKPSDVVEQVLNHFQSVGLVE